MANHESSTLDGPEAFSEDTAYLMVAGARSAQETQEAASAVLHGIEPLAYKLAAEARQAATRPEEVGPLIAEINFVWGAFLAAARREKEERSTPVSNPIKGRRLTVGLGGELIELPPE